MIRISGGSNACKEEKSSDDSISLIDTEVTKSETNGVRCLALVVFSPRANSSGLPYLSVCR